MALLAITAPSSSIAANTPSKNLAWPPLAHPGNDYIGFATVDNMQDGKMGMSQLLVYNGVEYSCTGFDDEFCKSKLTTYGWSAIDILPPCNLSGNSSDCIEGLNVTSNGVTKSSTLNRVLPYSTFAADPSRGLPQSSAPSLWSNPFSDDQNKGFLVGLSGYLKTSKPNATGSGPWAMSNFSASVTPYLQKSGSYSALTFNSVIDRTAHTFTALTDGCVWKDANQCGERTSFDSVDRIELKVHLDNRLTGWLGGRLQDPEISVSPLNSTQNLLTISAMPANVAYVSNQIPIASATSEMTALSKSDQGFTFSSWVIDRILKFFNAYKDSLKETNSAIIPTWSFTNGYGQPEGGCLSSTKKFLGLVTTNAATFQFEPPTFNGDTLDYKVASLHLHPDGTPFEGTYDLLLDSEAARCLYGFSKAPLSATISIIDDAGVQSVATSILSEKDGWLHLGSYGFHFSNPTLKVKLTQKGSVSSGSSSSGKPGESTQGSGLLTIKVPASGKFSLDYRNSNYSDLTLFQVSGFQDATKYIFKINVKSKKVRNLAIFPAETQRLNVKSAFADILKGSTQITVSMPKVLLGSPSRPLVFQVWDSGINGTAPKFIDAESLMNLPWVAGKSK